MEALVLLSGGQDSATCLAWAKTEFDEVHTVSFNYGQRHRIELQSSANLSVLAGAKSHLVIPILSIQSLGNSALVCSGDIGANHDIDSTLPASFVPGRNYIFLGLAAARAYQLNVSNLVTGVCQTDYSGYPDCRDLSIKAIEVALFLCLQKEFTIHTPLMWKTKAETVLMMKEFGKLDWYADTHTCYEGQRPPCGKCPACQLRQKGFREAGIVDPLMERRGW